MTHFDVFARTLRRQTSVIPAHEQVAIVTPTSQTVKFPNTVQCGILCWGKLKALLIWPVCSERPELNIFKLSRPRLFSIHSTDTSILFNSLQPFMSSGTDQFIIISNGEEFFEIPPANLASARADGFYLPHEQGFTVVSNGEETLEIPLHVLADAEAEGFQNLIPLPPDTAQLSSQPVASKKPASPQRKKALRKRTRRRKKSAALIAGLPVSEHTVSGAVRIETGEQAAIVDASELHLKTDDDDAPQETGPVAIDTGDDAPAPGDVTLDAVVLEEIIDEREERRREIKELLEEEENWKERAKLQIELHSPTPEQMKKFGRTYGLSTLLHIIVLVILSFIVFQTADKVDGGAIISSVMGDEQLVEEAAEIPQEVKIVETDQSQSETTNAADPAGALSNNVGAASDLSDFSGANVGGGLEGFSDALGDGADKMTGAGEKASAAFFGSKQLASSFVFVIDNSLSMTRGRFETALNELAKTVMALTPQQQFYIIFYSDTAYGLFHPQTARNLIPATPRNKQLTIQWLLTVELCLRTDFAEALQMAYALNPDVIFLLGDGGFTDEPRVRQVFASRSESVSNIKIHALGMELDQKGVRNFKALSDPTGGTYRDVGIHPLGAEMAARNPRRRNNKRGPIWGIRLK